MKCPSCASQKQGTLFRPTPAQITAASVVGLMMGIITGWAVEFCGFYMIFIAFALGGFAGELILRACGRRRGRLMEIITGVSIIIGALGGRILMAAILIFSANVRPPLGALNVIIDLVLPVPIPLIALVFAVAGAISRIRYL
ncbi:hypothetical protein LLG46_13025 [bacterium]|nr:hypothetical protein [bacterium]